MLKSFSGCFVCRAFVCQLKNALMRNYFPFSRPASSSNYTMFFPPVWSRSSPPVSLLTINRTHLILTLFIGDHGEMEKLADSQ